MIRFGEEEQTFEFLSPEEPLELDPVVQRRLTSKRMESLGPEVPDNWLLAADHILDLPIFDDPGPRGTVSWYDEDGYMCSVDQDSAHGEIEV